jgi:methionyl-tRNA formyltransferase
MGKKAIFIGNRTYVFNEIENNCDIEIIKIFAVNNSFLSNYLNLAGISYNTITSKDKLISEIQTANYDYLISNGCPYILPISSIRRKDEIYINIHPSLLPDLRGKHPINGAFLFHRDLGVTCHLMDDGIDTGQILEQIKVGSPQDMDLELAYKLCFEAEGEVFKKAYDNDFSKGTIFALDKEPIYYTRKDDDMVFNFGMPLEEIIRKIRAFAIESLGARFFFKGNQFTVFDCEILSIKYLNERRDRYEECEIIKIYHNNLIIKKDNELLCLKQVKGNIQLFKEGQTIFCIESLTTHATSILQ